MVHIMLIRHAESMANVEGRWSGRTEEDLSPHGYEQAQELAEKLRNVPIDHIYSSPMKRTKETIFPVALSHQLEITICPDLREADYGIFDGLTNEEMKQLYPNLFPIREDYLNRNIIPGQEPFLDVQKRVVDCITQLAHQNDGKTIVISSHYDAIRSFLSYVMNLSFTEVERQVNLYNTSIHEVVYDPNTNCYKVIQLSH